MTGNAARIILETMAWELQVAGVSWRRGGWHWCWEPTVTGALGGAPLDKWREVRSAAKVDRRLAGFVGVPWLR